jgi:hypothetical protein
LRVDLLNLARDCPSKEKQMRDAILELRKVEDACHKYVEEKMAGVPEPFLAREPRQMFFEEANDDREDS